MVESPSEIIAHHASKSAADSFTAWRKRIRKPLTETAAIRVAKQLAAITAAGGDADDALGMAEEHGWQTIKGEWYFGQRNRNQNTPATGNATIDAITFAGSAHRTPQKDCF